MSRIYNSTSVQDPQELAYYRSVYVLQHLAPLAAGENIAIPAYVKRHDTTESYLHHPDKVFVLHSVLADLENTPARYPKARLFKAYAQMALGEHDVAATLLNNYVAEAPYDERQYHALCENLKEAKDYTQMYLITREWQEREQEAGEHCSERRIICEWSALFHLGRFEEAGRLMQLEGRCLGWKSDVYAARALQEAGGPSDDLVQNLIKRYPEEQVKIEVFWERIKNRDDF